MSRKGKGVKESTKRNRYLKFDSDIASSYADYDDDVRPNARERDKQYRLLSTKPRRYEMAAGRLGLGAAGFKAETVQRVRIFRGSRFGLPWIIRKLSQQIEEFKPLLATTTSKGDIEFYLKDKEAASAVSAISRRILHEETGDRVIFHVDEIVAPWTRLDKKEVGIINEVVDSRYNPEAKSVDLTSFAKDTKFLERDMLMTLSKNNVMLTVINRIDEKYGGITALSLKDNRLRNLDYLATIVHIAKFVSVLDLSSNDVDTMEQLAKLKGLPVKYFFFEGNPACEKFTRSSDYLNAVQRVFPKIISLDGNEVPVEARIRDEEVQEKSDEPECLPSFFAMSDYEKMLGIFVGEYFKLYDGEEGVTTRKKLIDAYDQDHSQFSFSMANLPDSSVVRYHSDSAYGKYIQCSHNIAVIDKWKRSRSTRRFKGSMDIVVQLAKFPLTKHYLESFVLDVFLVTPSMMGFTVQGLFEDEFQNKPDKIPVLNFFSRTFHVVPRANNSLAIVSDMLLISALLPDRMSRYKMLMNKCASNGQKAATSVATEPQPSSSNSSTTNVLSDETKRLMVESFSQQSTMNLQYSLQCLEQSNWNYEVAGQRFMELRDQIPAEAFVK